MLDQSHAHKMKFERDYWLEKLAGNPVKSTFPNDIKGRNHNERKQERIGFEFSGELYAKLLKLSNNSDLRLHILLMSGVVGLLEKYSYGDAAGDIIIGAPIYRQEKETEFINTILVLRNRLTGDMKFKELLLQMSQTIAEANENVNYPIETLLYQLDIPYSPGDDFPLFDIVVLLENIHDKKYIEHIFPNMVFSFLRTEESLTGVLEYNSLLFKQDTIERITAHLASFFRSALSNLDAAVTQIEILSSSEKEQLLFDFNKETTAYPEHKTLHELFAEQVRKTPDAAAVVYETNQLSYKGLDERANRLARLLKTKGAGPDKAVALMVDRSIEMIVAIMAVLKSGAAFLPINPEHPQERIRYILQDSMALLLLTRANYLARDLGTGMLNLEDEENYRGDDANPASAANSMNLAYIIYTSGSTGEPKGVMVEHRNVTNLVCGLNNRIYKQYGGGLRVCLVAPYVFDASIQQIFAALLLGHILYIVPENTRVDGAALLDFFARYEIHISDGTPTHIHLMLESMNSRGGKKESPALDSVKHFIIGGEALPQKIVQRFFDCFAGNSPKITNVYGPAECCVDSTSFEITKDNAPVFREIPIGRPMPNEQVYIIDKQCRLRPIGVTGELCISGAGVSRGYLKREELTAAKFIPNPFYRDTACHDPAIAGSFTHPSPLLYKTGDLARWLPDGNLEFLGRLDFQVKIRGLRIELGEIENQLLKHEGIKEAVVLARDDDQGDKFLCAYIVGANLVSPRDSVPSAAELRDFLSNTLPDYMIPAFFIEIEKIPLTPNGKVDRRVLAAMAIEVSGGEKYAAPGNETEKVLAGIWSEVLRVEKEKIGIDDNFFELGGHSLKATVQIARIQKELDVKVPLAEVFNSPTIRELAAYINAAAQDKYSSIKALEKREHYPLSSAQRRLYFLQQLAPELTNYNVQTTLVIEGDFPVGRLADVFKQLITRHESFRTSFILTEGVPVQRVHDPVEVEFALEYYRVESAGFSESFRKGSIRGVDITTVKKIEKKVKSLDEIVDIFVRPFDLSLPPLLRVGLAILPDGRYLLMVDKHHIISDGVSDEILQEDFFRLYNGEELAALYIRYRDYSQWQRGLTENGEELLKKQEKYWLATLPGEIPVLDLPADYLRPPIQSFAGGRIGFEISAADTGALKEIETGQEISLYMHLLAVFNIMLAKLSAREDILVGSPIAGRRHAELESVIGMFVNTLVMRSHPYSEITFREFLKQVRENTLKAFENQEYQFEDLVESVAVKRDMSRNPLFDVMLVLQNMAMQRKKKTGEEVETKDIKVDYHRYNNKTARFDITLYAKEVQDQLLFTLEYCTALFKEETINRFINYFKCIISSVIANPDQRLAEIEIIPETEKELILRVFNDTYAEYPRNNTAQQLFAEQAAKSPDYTALVGAKHSELEQNGNASPLQSRQPLHLTYRELDTKASQLAGILRERGIRPGRIAAVMIERSCEMILAIFAVLKAGGAYLPIATDYPQERKQYILLDSTASLLLTIREQKKEDCRGEALAFCSVNECFAPTGVRSSGETGVGARHAVPSKPATCNLQPATSSLNLAYVIYTSGSTGNPKGVLTEHRALINRLNWMQKTFPLDEKDTLLQKTAFTFDVSVWEIFWWSLVGAKLCLLAPGGEKDPEMIARVLEYNRVTLIHFVPSMLNAFLGYMKSSHRLKKPSALKQVVVSGEALTPAQVMLFNETMANTKLANLYGPTEAAIDVSYFHCPPGENLDRVPIGKPIDNIRLLVLNQGNRLQPIGGVGELCITGDGLARGYINKPELTAEKFITAQAASFKPQASASHKPQAQAKTHQLTDSSTHSLVYRTGDLARWFPDGNIEFLGRIDHQVKIRGFRIEPGEIENLILKHDEVKEAVVLAKENQDGDKYLCAYIVAKSASQSTESVGANLVFARDSNRDADPAGANLVFARDSNRDADPAGANLVLARDSNRDADPAGANLVFARDAVRAELREYLSQNLPAYMVPAFFVMLDKIPLTANGKVDRKALPEPVTGSDHEYTAPANKTQEKIARIWQDVLNLERVGIRDKYFHVGGDSIRAIKLLSMINTTLKSDLQVVDIFTHDTIEKLANRIDRDKGINTREDKELQKASIEIAELKERVIGEGGLPLDIIEDIYPMSDIEKGMVFYSLKNPQEALYHDQFVFQLKYNHFCIETFKKALLLLVEKHSILRTAFDVENFADSIHIIYSSVPVEIEYYDISTRGREDREAFIKKILSRGRQKSFNITVPPLWRMTTFSTGGNNICIAWEFHHAVLDGWSNASLMTELHNTYLQLQTDAGFAPGKLKSSYRDFIIEQIAEKKKPERAEYWRRELEDYKRIDFSGLKEKEADKSPRNLKRFKYNIDPELKENLPDAAIGHNTSVTNLCFAAYLYMLAVLSFDNDILAGLVTNNRPLCEDGEKILGCFLNTIPVRLKIPPHILWRDYLKLVDKKVVEIKRNERISLFEILRIIAEKPQEKNPLFDTIFNYVDFHVYNQAILETETGDSPAAADNILDVEGYENTNTLFDFNIITTFGDFFIYLSYSNTLISDDYARKLCRCFEALLEKFVYESGCFANKEELMTEEEKEKLLSVFNNTAADFPGDKTIRQLFTEQAARTPDNTALIGPKHSELEQNGNASPPQSQHSVHLTYRELNEKSGQVAVLLRKKGLMPNTAAAIMVERSIEMMVGIFAILQAGGAYLPINPAYPAERKDFILRDSSAKVLLTTRSFFKEVEKLRSLQVETVFIEDCRGEPCVRPSGKTVVGARRAVPSVPAARSLQPATSPSNLVYIIYTSGSTGNPKGVAVEHRSVVNILYALQTEFPLTEADAYLLKTSYLFDVSVAELFGWYMAGGRLVILEKDGEKDPDRILTAIEKNRITHINFVPSMFNVFVEGLDIESISKLATLKYIFLAGEALLPGLVEKFRQFDTHIRLENIYGPTEGTVYSSRYSLSLWQGGDIVPIGKPLQNIRLYILDKDGNLLPPGIPGELVISGIGLARGYLNNPELTAEKILFNSGKLNKSYKSYRTYKTGDLARWLPDGNLEFLGRIDFQVKIRGFRIELGEIENLILKHDAVKEAVVLAKENQDGDKYLCAYIVAKSTTQSTESVGANLVFARGPNRDSDPVGANLVFARDAVRTELREYLAEILPDYMIPAFFVSLQKIPLTINGKIDRKSLPAPEKGSADNYAAPRTRLEEKLVQIWSRVLDIDSRDSSPIGIDSSFFELGGHSLKAAALMSGIHKELNIRVNLAQIFRTSTIRSLAEYIAGVGREQYTDIKNSEKKEFYPLTSAQKRLFIYDQVEGEEKGIAYNMPNIHLFQGNLDREKFARAFVRLVARHETLRTSFHMTAGEAVQKIAGQVDFKVKYHKCSQTAARERMKEFVKPFVLSRAPLLRVELIEIGESRYYIMFDMHHIATDGVSMEILLKEFAALYQGKEPDPLRIQYKDYAAWQDKFFTNEEFNKQENYWLNKLAGFTVTRIPRDNYEPGAEITGKSQRFRIEPSLYKKIENFCNRHGITKFTFVLTVFNILLYRETGQGDITLGIPSANRDHHDLKNLIGIFLNVLLVRSVFDEDYTFLSLLTRVKDTVFEAMDNRYYPFEVLHAKIREANPSRGEELFTVFVNYFKSDDKENPGQVGEKAALIPANTEELFPKYPINLYAADSSRTIKLNITYMSNLYSEHRIKRMADNFINISEKVLAEEDTRIGDIEIRDTHSFEDFTEELQVEIESGDILI